jgi:hypothetical protein
VRSHDWSRRACHQIQNPLRAGFSFAGAEVSRTASALADWGLMQTDQYAKDI